MKRRQRIRTITIVATLVIIAASLVVGFYIALNSGSTGLDKFVGVAVSPADMSTLYQVSHADFGQSGSSLLVSSGAAANLKAASGSPFFANGKPVVVYIGADFCPYCAVERWSLLMAFSRFGNFSNLHYMTSGSGSEGDYATFTFTGSSYSSKYLVFTPIEQEDRNRAQIASIPSNYSAEFQNAYPFVNFGNRYILSTLIPGTGILTNGNANKNWTQIFADISTSTPAGITIKEGANAITALICRIIPSTLQDANSNKVCNAYAITSTNIGLAGPSGASEGIMSTTSTLPRATIPERQSWS